MVNNPSPYKLFARFLKERKCYHRFITQIYKSKALKQGIVYDVYLPRFFLMGAFKWADTPQGNSFWYEIHKQWLQTLKYNTQQC